MSASPHAYRLPRSHRLGGRNAFAAVYQAHMRKNAGPLAVHTRPNGLGHHRLGLSVGRRVGTAVERNRIKRLLREAFRLSRHDWPGGYDVVIHVYPHPPLTLSAYQTLLAQAMASAHPAWEKRRRRQDPPA